MLDLAVFAPLGLAVSVAEALPELAAKGRARLVPQLGLARTVGQFAVGQAYRRAAQAAGEATSLPSAIFGKPAGIFGRPAGIFGKQAPAGTSRGGGGLGEERRPADRTGGPAPGTHRSSSRAVSGAGGRAGRARDEREAQLAASLAIPSYDSLSAPQVVQRLAGLSRDEIEAVRRYEAATRGRRTILARAEQLLS